MISGVSGTRKGVMFTTNSYIGGKPSQDLCRAWNVILSDSSRVIDSDCGSLIVDQVTLEVYGHVVASNPLGEAYVVPFQDTFQQIGNTLGAKDLSLPNSRLLMERLVAHYIKEGDSGVADEAKQILASMEVAGSTSPLGSLDGQDQRLYSSSNGTVQSGISSELPSPSLSAHDQDTFPPQYPIGNYPDEGLSASNQQESPHIPSQPNKAPQVKSEEQNPPCNTLVVENLPRDTSQDELMAIFSKRRGFERLCFRTKQNGPMCLVEFEDVSSATKCIQDLNRMSLQNSTQGEIRLSFSKNPLGVLSGPLQPAEEIIPFHVSLNDGNRKSDGDSYIALNTQRPTGAMTLFRRGPSSSGVVAFEPTFRTNSRGETEWRYRNVQSTSTSSVDAYIARFNDTLQPDTVSKDKAQYSVEQNHTKHNKGVGALTDSLATTSLVPIANGYPCVVACLNPNNTSTQHRNFDPHYRVHRAHEFKFGKVFKVLWSESTADAQGGTIVSRREVHGEHIVAKVRRFLIVDPKKGHCLCLPIMNYEGRATSKLGVHAEEHAIIYTTPKPILVANEDGTKMKYHPVKMVPESSRHKLDIASRINYHKVYNIEYNVKVWFIGRIDQSSEQTVISSYNQAHQPSSQSTQALLPSSYLARNSAHSSSNQPAALDYDDIVSPSARNYEGTGCNTGSSSFIPYGGFAQSVSSAHSPSAHPPSAHPPSQFPPSSPSHRFHELRTSRPSQCPPGQYNTSQYLAYTSNEDRGWESA
ncbi:hypothetical protein EAE96_007414 [Botrytis aclada]|nr:hypothetical protein EAE96_007414 [Botrytis aclada]